MRPIVVALLSTLASAALAAPVGDEADVTGAATGALATGAPLPLELMPFDLVFPVGPATDPGPMGIVNGTEVGAFQNENVVALGALDRFGQGFVFCSGSLIDDTWVLTAAHCVEGMDYLEDYGYDLSILFGGDIINEGYTDAITWRRGIPNPTYNGAAFLNDIGLVEMVAPKAGVDFVVLNDEGVTNAWHGAVLTIFGYGITSDNADNAGTKRTTEIPIVDHDTQYVYTYDPDTNVCSGDSGGPAFETTTSGDLEQVGVNAFVTPGCVGGSAGLTRVDMYIDSFIIGYVPDIIVEGDGVGSGGEEPTDPGTDGGLAANPDNPDAAEDLDSDEIDVDLGTTPRPGKNAYPLGTHCGHTGGVPIGGWLFAVGLLVGGRRVKWRCRA